MARRTCRRRSGGKRAVTAPAPAASRWVVEIRDRGVWVPRCNARATEVEAGEVRARLQAKQPGGVFRVVEA